MFRRRAVRLLRPRVAGHRPGARLARQHDGLLHALLDSGGEGVRPFASRSSIHGASTERRRVAADFKRSKWR